MNSVLLFIRMITACVLVSVLFGQQNLIFNPDFELEDEPSIQGWTTICNFVLIENDPENEDGWCLALESGNYQGCYPGTASQIITELLPSPDVAYIINLSSWAYVSLGLSVNPVIRLRDISTGLNLSSIPIVDSTWQHYQLQDTLYNFSASTEIGIVLDAGNLSGPAGDQVLFDHPAVFLEAVLQKGDVNADQGVDILDIVALVLIILDEVQDEGQYAYWAADANSDGQVDVLDIISLINVGPYPEG